MKRLKTISIISLFCCFTTILTNAQNIDERLWATWNLETVELTVQGTTQKYSWTVLRANKNLLPRNMFTALYFFDDQVGINSSETEFVSVENLCMKGSFSTNNGELIITLCEEQPRKFTYTIENDVLKLMYTVGITQLNLSFKLTLKNVR